MDGEDTSSISFEDVTSTEDAEVQSEVGEYYDGLIDTMNGDSEEL